MPSSTSAPVASSASTVARYPSAEPKSSVGPLDGHRLQTWCRQLS
nr:hypothetical protein [Actinomadura madurae]